MPYSEKLADRIAVILKGKRGISTRKMFGGICFLLNGNMLCGLAQEKLVARVGSKAYEKLLQQKYAKPMNFTGKPMKGMVYVLADGIKTKASLEKWVNHSISFVKTLPKKEKK